MFSSQEAVRAREERRAEVKQKQANSGLQLVVEPEKRDRLVMTPTIPEEEEVNNALVMKLNLLKQRKRSKNASISTFNIIKAQSLEAHTKALRSRKRSVCDLLKQMRYSLTPCLSMPATPFAAYQPREIASPHLSTRPETESAHPILAWESKPKFFKRIKKREQKPLGEPNNICVIPIEYPLKLEQQTIEKHELLPLLLNCQVAKFYRKNETSDNVPKKEPKKEEPPRARQASPIPSRMKRNISTGTEDDKQKKKSLATNLHTSIKPSKKKESSELGSDWSLLSPW